MVRSLPRPARPLRGGRTSTWSPPGPGQAWSWCRVYHRDDFAPAPDSFRGFGPLARFDHHRPDAAGQPQTDPDGRTVLYVGGTLVTSACEVFGEAQEALLCPSWRVANLVPSRPLSLLDLLSPGAAMSVGALPSLGDADVGRELTQEWARAIVEDRPTDVPVQGVQYRTGHAAGHALALWDCADAIEVVDGSDAPLRDPGVYADLLAELPRLGITVSLVTTCPRCPDS